LIKKAGGPDFRKHAPSCLTARRPAKIVPPPIVSERIVNEQTLALLLSRRSVSPKYLRAPAPSDAELDLALRIAMRGPDHKRLRPYRFVVLRDEALERLAQLFVAYGRQHGKTEEDLKLERQRAVQAPLVIGVVARLTAHADVADHEQWIAVGAALGHLLMALHALGYGAKMLSGRRASDPTIAAAFCEPGERLVGWVSVGTPADGAAPRHSEDDLGIIKRTF
jgi:nitroreductase